MHLIINLNIFDHLQDLPWLKVTNLHEGEVLLGQITDTLHAEREAQR